ATACYRSRCCPGHYGYAQGRRGDKSSTNLIGGDAEQGLAFRRLVVGAIGGLQDQPVIPRRKILHLNDQAEGDDGVAFLYVLLQRDWAGKENLFVGGVHDAVTSHNPRRRIGLQQRLVHLRINHHFVRLLERVVRRRRDLHAFNDHRRAVFKQRGVDIGGNLVHGLEGFREHDAAEREFLPVVGVNLQRRLE